MNTSSRLDEIVQLQGLALNSFIQVNFSKTELKSIVSMHFNVQQHLNFISLDCFITGGMHFRVYVGFYEKHVFLLAPKWISEETLKANH